MITWNTDVNAPCCPGEIVNDDGRTLLIQSDWDYCGTANSFGWSLVSVQRDRCPDCGNKIDWLEEDANGHPSQGVCMGCGRDFQQCQHDATDGTVDCKECGVTASEFMAGAYDWLRDNDGVTAADPGYFS